MTQQDRTVYEFANRIAKVMDKAKSSNVYFVVQQAYPDDGVEWISVQDILTNIITITDLALIENKE